MTDPIDDLLSWFDNEDANANGQHANTARGVIAESLVIHGLLTDIGEHDGSQDNQRIQRVMQQIVSEPAAAKVRPVSVAIRARRLLKNLAALASIVAAAFFIAIAFSPQQSVSAATASLDKVVEAAARRLDRTYTVHLVEDYSRDKRPRKLSNEAWQREAPEQIDGATIYVRGANEYVMKVLLKTGVIRTSGCDGKLSWSFRENGPVHVSKNLNRFRGGMPGNQQDIPFLNLHENLSQLKVGYDVELSVEADTTEHGTVLSHLICHRKLDMRGSKRVDIWFAPEDGTVHKMLLDGLPRGRGGPKRVMLELIDQSKLAPGFFSHESHHEPGRRIKHEGAQR